jgi:hypothetical protein
VLATSIVAGTGETQNIQLPYGAFDMQASYPFYQNATNYFPIRRAANNSQYTIGRTFLQEAYLIADHERSNFTVAQATFDNLNSKHLVAIEKPVANATNGAHTATATTSSSSISGGAIAGIVIGAIVGVTLIVLAAWFFIRRNKRKHQPLPTSEPKEPGTDSFYPPDNKFGGVMSSELPSESHIVEAPAGQKRPSELPSPPLASEVEGDMGKSRARPGLQELPSDRDLVEAPESHGVRYELVGSTPTGQDK